ncbi:hypothetical protein KY320_03780 [Candidatus Woesearchaeota archaeon]|nr:hypothetical protein [Candidatus Woesearchaeota archaeon]
MQQIYSARIAVTGVIALWKYGVMTLMFLPNRLVRIASEPCHSLAGYYRRFGFDYVIPGLDITNPQTSGLPKDILVRIQEVLT